MSTTVLLNAEREPHVLALDDMKPPKMTRQVLFILYSYLREDCLERDLCRCAGCTLVPRYQNSFRIPRLSFCFFRQYL